MMSRSIFVIFFSLVALPVWAQSTAVQNPPNQLSYESSIPWNPKSYVCQRTVDEIVIDGLADEESWEAAKWTAEFVDIEGVLKPNPALKTNVKMLWDETYFYFFAKMEEPHIWAKLTERDAIIYQDDDFEIFIDPDGDAHNYYEFEINALNTIWDLFMMWPYRHKVHPNYLFNWNVNALHAVHVEGTLNDPSDLDAYWTVEMAIPWSALKEMAPRARPPKSRDQWRINFSRVDWTMDSSTGSYEKVLGQDGKPLPEDNWVWSPQGAINMHLPEWWGYVQFSDAEAGTSESPFAIHPDEEVKWALWQMYYQQTQFFEEKGYYLNDISRFTIPKITKWYFKPKLFAGEHGFQISSPNSIGNRDWVINEMGKIILKKRL